MAVSRLLRRFSGRDSAAVITPANTNLRLEILDDFEHAGIGWLWATDAQGQLIYISENAAEKLNRPWPRHIRRIFRRCLACYLVKIRPSLPPTNYKMNPFYT
jgi:hypothetical protein